MFLFQISMSLQPHPYGNCTVHEEKNIVRNVYEELHPVYYSSTVSTTVGLVLGLVYQFCISGEQLNLKTVTCERPLTCWYPKWTQDGLMSHRQLLPFLTVKTPRLNQE